MTKPYQNNHKKFWLAGFFNTSKILQKKEKNIQVCDELEAEHAPRPESTLMPVFDFAQHVQSPFDFLAQF